VISYQYERIDYEDRALSIFPLRHFAELRWGIHFKETEEFAIYSVFYDDGSKAYKGFYRSDDTFQKEESLYP
jgi:hypothetical protein